MNKDFSGKMEKDGINFIFVPVVFCSHIVNVPF